MSKINPTFFTRYLAFQASRQNKCRNLISVKNVFYNSDFY